MGWRRTSVPIERFGVYDPEVDLDGPRDPLPDVEHMLGTCSPLGRRMLMLVALDGMSVKQAARMLGMPLTIATRAHNAACVDMAGEFRRLGWTEEKYRAAIAGG